MIAPLIMLVVVVFMVKKCAQSHHEDMIVYENVSRDEQDTDNNTD